MESRLPASVGFALFAKPLPAHTNVSAIARLPLQGKIA